VLIQHSAEDNKYIHITSFISDSGRWKFITSDDSKTPKPTTKPRIPIVDDNDDNVDEILERMSKSGQVTSVPRRRYDVLEKGRPDLFRGWADVQGTGMANDYCRYLTEAFSFWTRPSKHLIIE